MLPLPTAEGPSNEPRRRPSDRARGSCGPARAGPPRRGGRCTTRSQTAPGAPGSRRPRKPKRTRVRVRAAGTRSKRPGVLSTEPARRKEIRNIRNGKFSNQQPPPTPPRFGPCTLALTLAPRPRAYGRRDRGCGGGRPPARRSTPPTRLRRDPVAGVSALRRPVYTLPTMHTL